MQSCSDIFLCCQSQCCILDVSCFANLDTLGTLQLEQNSWTDIHRKGNLFPKSSYSFSNNLDVMINGPVAAEGSFPAAGPCPMFHYAEEQKSVKLKVLNSKQL